MILLVDTSVWVDYFQTPDSTSAQKFDAALGKDEIVLGDLIVVEICKGFAKDGNSSLSRPPWRPSVSSRFADPRSRGRLRPTIGPWQRRVDRSRDD
jgi:predicted nucleic acid-binding protein